jgi:abortive infection bacteriophage resistance protein
MQYAKPALTFEQQADLLLRRGMSGDRGLMIARLSCVNYYRLSGYWYPFRSATDQFVPGTSFDEIWNRYAFDRRLRLLVIDAVERVEITVRTLLAYEHAHAHGPFAYAEDPRTMPNLDAAELSDFLARVAEEANRSREPFVSHFKEKYGNCHQYLPVWEATEIMALGTLVRFFTGATPGVKAAVASRFCVPERVLRSWLLALNAARNISAHHGRMWNRVPGVKPYVPRSHHYPDWHRPVKIENDRVFGLLTICRYCLREIAPQSAWSDRLAGLLREFPTVPLADMGFPANWQDSRLWQ